MHFIRDCLFNSSDTSEDEMDDQDINQILIVTQKPRRILSKHPQGDRTSGSHQSRNKMTTDLAQTINDGLYYYEQVRKYFLCRHTMFYS